MSLFMSGRDGGNLKLLKENTSDVAVGECGPLCAPRPAEFE